MRRKTGFITGKNLRNSRALSNRRLIWIWTQCSPRRSPLRYSRKFRESLTQTTRIKIRKISHRCLPLNLIRRYNRWLNSSDRKSFLSMKTTMTSRFSKMKATLHQCVANLPSFWRSWLLRPPIWSSRFKKISIRTRK